MARKRIYDVMPDGSNWTVRERTGVYVARHRTRDEALQDGRRVALGNKPSHLVIRNADGAIEDERAFDDSVV